MLQGLRACQRSGLSLRQAIIAPHLLPFKHAIEGIYPSVRLRAPAFPGTLRRAFAVDNWLYEPFSRLVQRAACAVSRTHVGVPQVYLLWIVAGAVAVIGLVLLLAR